MVFGLCRRVLAIGSLAAATLVLGAGCSEDAGPELVAAEATAVGVVAFDSDREGDPDIYVMDADGRNVVRVVSDPGFDLFPSLSPDGRQIVWMSNRGGDYDLYVQELGTREPRQLTSTPDDDEGHTARFSPDGNTLVFTRVPSDEGEQGNVDVIVMDLATEVETNLTAAHLGRDGMPDWSPDGASIVFVSDRDGPEALYLIAADGSSDAKRLTTDEQSYHWPAFSPDGSQLLATVAPTIEAAPSSVLWVFDLDIRAGAVAGVASMRSIEAMPGAVYPSWSSDGGRVFVQANVSGTAEIHVIDLDSGELDTLTRTAFSSRHPSSGVPVEPIVVSGDYVLRAEISGSKASEFAGTSFPFEWTGEVALSELDLMRLRAGDNDPKLVKKVLGVFIEPANDGRFDGEPSWVVNGSEISGQVAVWSANGGTQGTLRIEAEFEGSIGADTMELHATQIEALSTWDFGDGPFDLPTTVEVFQAKVGP